MPPVLPVATLVAVYAIVVALGLPILEESRPTAPLGRWIARHSSAGTPVGIYRVDDWRASIRYYTDRAITHLEGTDDVQRFLNESPGAYIVMLRKDYVALHASGFDIQEVAARRAIVGRTGRYFRRQIWDRLAVVTGTDRARALALNDTDIQ